MSKETLFLSKKKSSIVSNCRIVIVGSAFKCINCCIDNNLVGVGDRIYCKKEVILLIKTQAKRK